MIEIYKDKRGEWRWSFIKNGNVIADSAEGYFSASNARRAARRTGASMIFAKVRNR